jgi:hypothetical protein
VLCCLLICLVERMCKGKKWPVVRLDGSLAVKKRMELVNAFNDEKNRNAFCFLLSSKVINKSHCACVCLLRLIVTDDTLCAFVILLCI